MKMVQLLLLAAFVALGRLANGAFEITDISPVTGPPTTVITVTGTGFEPAQSYSATINGRAATVRNVTSTGLELVVAAGTVSGSVIISDGAASRTAIEPFVVTRVMPGRFITPAAVGVAGYGVIGYHSVPPLAATSATEAAFTIEVPVDQPVVLWALRAVDDPPFLAVVTSDESEAVLDAGSTALALALLNPALAASDDAKARALKAKIRERNLALEVRTFLEANARAGLSYLEDARYEAAMVRLLTEVLKPEEPAGLRAFNVDPVSPSGTLLKPINKELLLSELTTKLTLQEPTADRPGDYVLQVDVGSRFSSLDWIVEVFRLRRLTPDFPDGLASVHALTYTSTPAFANNTAVGEAYLPAKLDSARVDYFKALAEYVIKKVEGAVGDPNALKNNQLLIPANRPDIYIVQAYSGNIFWRYGGQEYILDAHDPNSAWAAALAGNTFMAVVDFATIFIDFKKVTGINDAGFINAQLKNLSKAITAKLQDGQLTDDEFLELVGVSAKALISNALSKIAERASDEGIFATFSATTGAMLSSGFDIFKKVSSGLQVVERGGGLILPGRLAVERTVLVVGDPFPPVIRELSPQSARKNELVSILGQNFPFGAATVEFCVFAEGAGEEAEPFKKLAATVISKGANTIVVKVPADFETVFGEGDRVVFRVTDGVKRGDSRRLGSDGVFRYVPPPTLVSVRPLQQIPEGDLVIEGRNFTANSTDQVLLIDGVTVLAPTGVGSGFMNCLLPSALAKGPHTIAVRLGTDVSAALPFEVVDVPDNTGDLTTGVSIEVTTTAMNNNPDDGKISLLEAILIGRGQLGRPIQEHLPCELLPAGNPSHCPRQEREIDHIFGTGGGGALAADFISFGNALAGQTILLSAPLAPGSGDTLAGTGVILDGSGISFGEGAVELTDNFGVTLTRCTLQNSGGHGIRIQGGGQHQLLSLSIETSLGDGVVLDSGTANNLISSVTTTNSGRHGVHITGSSSSNEVRILRTGGNVRSGIFLEGSARNNKLLEISAIGNGLHGLHLAGAGVQDNRVHGLGSENPVRGVDLYDDNEGYGILLDQGANHNTVSALYVRRNHRGGIAVFHHGTEHNYIGFSFSRGFANTPHIRVYDNQGPGVSLGAGAQHNAINHVTVAGNNGDGVLLEGPDCAFNNIGTIWTGYDFFATGGPVPKQNAGHGIHLRAGARENQIGSRRYPQTYSHRSLFVNNALSGILVEGADTDRNHIFRADFGYTLPASFYSANRALFKANGQDGVTVRGGAKWTIIGDENVYFDCHIFGSPGAGVRLAGDATTDNTVFNCHFGYSHGPINLLPEDKNRFGIVVEAGAKRNFIGVRGDRRSFSEYPFTFEFGNTIANSLEAGVVLDGCGGLLGMNDEPGDANIIQNNTIGVFNFTPPSFGNPVGILITGRTKGNIIGGTLPATANTIQANERAGIHLKDSVVDEWRARTFIAGNTITRQGVTVVDPPPVDILTRTPHGVGVLLSGFSEGNIIGEGSDIPNDISQNIAGVFLEGAGVFNTLIMGNQISGPQPAGGVIISQGAHASIGGPYALDGNIITGNGDLAFPDTAAIVLIGGGSHAVQNNRVRLNPTSAIKLIGSNNNLIGGPEAVHANFITQNNGSGIFLKAGASANVIQNNFIGTDRAGANLGNTFQGIHLEFAGPNTIGAWWNPSPDTDPLALGNTIAFNAGMGISLFETEGVSILHNSIHDNGLEGIGLGLNANHNVPPPLILSYGTTIAGRVVDLAQGPPGSRVQLFSDNDGEGRTFLGETDVKADGSWALNQLPIIPFKLITGTLTHAGGDGTSAFGVGFPLVSGFSLRRDGPPAPATRQLPVGVQRAAVHRLVAETGALPVAIKALALSTTGSLPEDVAVTAVFAAVDGNANGEFDEADREISPRVRFAADQPDLVLAITSLVVPAKSARKILIIYEFAQPTPAGVSFDLALASASAVTAETVFPFHNPVTPLGLFPIRSDLLEFIGLSFNFQAWRARHFTVTELDDPAISGPAANPDGDRLVNALEYAFGFDPKSANANAMPRLYQDTSGRLVYEYQRRRSAPDVLLAVRFSDDLVAWGPGNLHIQSTETTPLTDETERVRLVLNGTFPRAFLDLYASLLP